MKAAKVSTDEREDPPPNDDPDGIGGVVVGGGGEVLETVAGASGEGGTWDVLRVLDASNGEAEAKCRMDGCEERPVRVWVETSQPTDEWPLCAECEVKEFGDDPEVGAEGKDTAESPTVSDQKVGTSADKDEGEEPNEDNEPTIDGVGETWELHRILSVHDITDASVQCSNAKCKTPAACVWVSNLAPKVDWFSCLDCQTTDFGGFPPVNELPVSSLDPVHLETMAKHCSRKKNPKMPDFGMLISSETPGKPPATTMALITPAPPLENEEEEEAEAWDLKRILSVEDIKDCPIKCSSESCALPAACIWVSNQAPTTKWYSCLDCQTKDFGGWPPVEELPVSFLAKQHTDFLAQKCSRQKAVDMPSFPMVASPSSGGASINASSHSLVTPLPDGLTQDDGEDGSGGTGAAKTKKQPPVQQNAQPSKQALAMHQKWQEAAVAMGGKDARIVVSKPKAKKLIFDLLENAFRPMNITDIHKDLKAVVPSPVLKACLDEMVDSGSTGNPTFDDSDDEEGAKKIAAKKAKSGGGSEDAASATTTNDSYKLSLCFKAGKTSNASLYYVDYTKLKNSGNGLEPHARNELAADLAKSQAEEEALAESIKQLTKETEQLLSEPTNVEAVARLEAEEAELVDLAERVEAGRKLKVNEKHKVKVKRGIESMTAQWRKRRRICMDFLISMEESSDGSISMKKCLSGDGPIDVDSDEAVAKGAVAYALKKRSAPALTAKKRAPPTKKSKLGSAPSNGNEALASEDFVAVALTSQGTVSRVMVGEETK